MPPVKKTEEKPTEEDQPKYVTAEDLEEIVDRKLNGAITGHMKRFEATITKSLTTQLAEFGEKLKPAEPEPDKKKTDGDPEWKREMTALQKKLEASEAARIKESEAREIERQARMRDEERGMLGSALRKQGVEEIRAKHAVAYLYGEEKRIARSEDGRIVFRLDGKHGPEEMDIEKGVTEWLKTDEGKLYVPARPVGGSGGRPTAQQSNGSSTGKVGPSDDEIGRGIMQMFLGGNEG